MKRYFRIGAIVGGVFGVVIAISMDALLGQNPSSGWSGAVAHDLNLLLKADLGPGHPLVIIGVVVVIGFFGAIGALAGGAFTATVFRFFHALTKED